MNWNQTVWLYCERGTGSGLFAEPVNALSAMSFLLAGAAALWIYRTEPFLQKSTDHLLLIGLTFLTGLGSLAFHLLATQASELAHLLPFVLLMFVYFSMALNRFLELPAGAAAFISISYLIMTIAGLTMSCPLADAALQPQWSIRFGGATSCFNGTAGYVPTLIMLAGLSFWLHRRGHQAARSMMLATGLFLAALFFHAIDHLFCLQTFLFVHFIGTHWIWHILNGVATFYLLRALMLYQNVLPVQEILPPDPRSSKR
ncbi:MAG: hypothetical protein L3J67_01345 [Hyphomicrobiaceae bacterium]|nr:hypothetical protein [Hyphomicrobiaceae bacterium]